MKDDPNLIAVLGTVLVAGVVIYFIICLVQEQIKPKMILGSLVLVIFLLCGMLYYGPTYNVWQKELAGKAVLKQAEWSRQVAVEEAEATLESAKFLAQAEIERAKGVAESNRIVADGLGGPEGYLTYLQIQAIRDIGSTGKIIYIPTEAGLPILEAGRLK